MKISARNVFAGKVTKVRVGAVNSEVDLTTKSGLQVVAIITNESVKSLDLAVGREATALIKASSVLVLLEGADVKLSARNCFAGKISKLAEGPISAEVTIILPGGDHVHATITHESSKELKLKVGMPATAVFKAQSVILAVAA